MPVVNSDRHGRPEGRRGAEVCGDPNAESMRLIDIARPGSECLPRGRPHANQRPSAIRGSVALGLPRFTTVALEDKTVPEDTGGSGPWRRRRVTDRKST